MHGNTLVANYRPIDLKRLDINKKVPHSHKWLPLGYPPYPVEYEINRFWHILTTHEWIDPFADKE